MKKLFLIGLKDVRLVFRDRTALMMMLLAPFLLTLGLGFVSGRFSGGSSSGLSHIPVVIADQDAGQLGNALVELFSSPDLQELVAAREVADPAAARQSVDRDQAAVAILIPPGFTLSIIPAQGQSQAGTPVQIELYSNPASPTSAGVIKTIVDQFLSQVEVGRIGGEVAVSQLLSHGLIQPQQAAQVGAQVGAGQAVATGQTNAITIQATTNGGKTIPFDVLAYMAPGMALMFLMFTASNGGRVLLAERSQGTLPRLLVAPVTSTQVMGGKIFGTFLTGVLQVLVLILASTLLFRLVWGDAIGVLALVLAAVFAAVGWGMIITAISKTPGQVSWMGTALMLIFGLLGGSFINLDNLPSWFKIISKITPNAWGLDGFTTLALGGSLADILTPILALLAMGTILFFIAVLLFNRNGITQA